MPRLEQIDSRLRLPGRVHPDTRRAVFDETSERCNVDQRGRVWFSAPIAHLGSTTRSCTISQGTAVLLAVAAYECSNIEEPPFFGANEAELRACAAAGFDEVFTGPLTLSVDGSRPQSVRHFRTQTPVFSFTLPEDNVFGVPGPITATKAVSDGVFVMLKPLKRGEHSVVMHGEDAFGGVVDQIYNLTVVDDEDH